MSRTDMHVQVTYNGKQVAYTISLGTVPKNELEEAMLAGFKRAMPQLLDAQGDMND